ncbi:MAG: RNA methyltransferase [Hyphomicrobiaceae bacterium]|nr:RNA methyltransferase [Hyphomicrobiaceae bacterium]
MTAKGPPRDGAGPGDASGSASGAGHHGNLVDPQGAARGALGRSARQRPGATLAITSLQNDRIKAIRALDMRKERKASGLFVAEGAALLMTARDNGWTPETVVAHSGALESGAARDLAAWTRGTGADVLAVSEAVLGKLASKDNPQSLLAVFRQRWAKLPDAGSIGPADVWLALEEIRDPGNLGTIVRTADAVGAKGIVLVGTCCDPWSRECVRATMGSIFAVPIVRTEPEAFLSWLGIWPGDAIATHLAATDDFRTARFRRPSIVMMGGEGPGLSPALTEAATVRVKIPMAGRLDSLNLAVATALMLYQVRGPDLSI